jgi:hypothetical protein
MRYDADPCRDYMNHRFVCLHPISWGILSVDKDIVRQLVTAQIR